MIKEVICGGLLVLSTYGYAQEARLSQNIVKQPVKTTIEEKVEEENIKYVSATATLRDFSGDGSFEEAYIITTNGQILLEGTLTKSGNYKLTKDKVQIINRRRTITGTKKIKGEDAVEYTSIINILIGETVVNNPNCSFKQYNLLIPYSVGPEGKYIFRYGKMKMEPIEQ